MKKLLIVLSLFFASFASKAQAVTIDSVYNSDTTAIYSNSDGVLKEKKAAIVSLKFLVNNQLLVTVGSKTNKFTAVQLEMDQIIDNKHIYVYSGYDSSNNPIVIGLRYDNNRLYSVGIGNEFILYIFQISASAQL